MKKAKKFGWGGARPGAGRPKSPDSGVSHLARPKVNKSAELKLLFLAKEDVDLEKAKPYAVIKSVFAENHEPFGLKVNRVVADGRRLHVHVTAPSREALMTGAQSLAVRVARQCNRVLGRKGKFWDDRYAIEMA